VKVLVIPEDPTLDQHILKPIVEALLRDLGRKARVDVLQDPHLSGVEEALSQEVIEGIVAENPMVDLFLLMVDRDCNRMRNVERAADREAGHPGRLVACLAVEEVEVWMLALHRDALGERWSAIRSDCDPKERYADPFLREKGWLTEVGRGRKHAMRELPTKWGPLLSVCPELAELRDRLRSVLALPPG
jgi:hypothetical protein